MKTFSEYIAEARELIGKPPFSLEELETLLAYFDEAVDNEFTDDIMDRIETAWGPAARSYFHELFLRKSFDADPEKLYNEIQKIPKERLVRLLGAGGFGFAISIDKDKVIKWFFDGLEGGGILSLSRGDKAFYTYCLNNKSKVFPRVYRLTDRYVLMEKLKTGTRKTRLYSTIMLEDWESKYGIRQANSTKFTTSPEYIARYATKFNLPDEPMFYDKDIDDLRTSLTKQDLEVFNWLLEVYKEAGRGNFDPSDCNPNNFGERQNGDVVWFDI